MRNPMESQQAKTTTSAQIRAIHCFSTGWGEQHPEHRLGSRMPRLWWVLTSRRWVTTPIHAFLIEHTQGPVLFDTGLDPAIVSDPQYIDSAVGRFLLLHRIFRFHIRAGDGLKGKLDGLGVAVGDVHTAVISHLHFDHVGGIAAIPQAELLVSREEWAQLSEPHPEREWILREHIELPGAKWRPIEFATPIDPVLAPFGGCHDVMGDGALILLPTPGHTPGSVSMLVRSGTWPPLLFVADLGYASGSILEDRVPGTGDPVQLREAYAKVRELKEALPDLVILPSHDPETAQRLADATGTDLKPLGSSMDRSKRISIRAASGDD